MTEVTGQEGVSSVVSLVVSHVNKQGVALVAANVVTMMLRLRTPILSLIRCQHSSLLWILLPASERMTEDQLS